ncbi:hypothetical protein N5K21_20500 [Rhizobium pusense]|uniref:hypothetical protein n=1 Tax=Agrobacterium pusense TaxID=648995 RepID=UPI00244AE5C5|nr:hypothetical protein [Agrobacterium pusense]MDH2091116.1 hypothetical protein [Agrobacterium pusense]
MSRPDPELLARYHHLDGYIHGARAVLGAVETMLESMRYVWVHDGYGGTHREEREAFKQQGEAK